MGLHMSDNGENESGVSERQDLVKTEMNAEQAKTPSRRQLESWLNKNMKIEMTDGRVLIGIFLCTDRDRNVILGSCAEYLKLEHGEAVEEPRVLGLAMVPGHHIVSIHVDSDLTSNTDQVL